MSLTLALSSMDNATETALRAAFSGANAHLGERFLLVGEPDSEHVIVDMDSMYGPMNWLRLHAAGKQIVGLTSAPRVQTRFRLGRPFDDSAMAALLREIAATQDTSLVAHVPPPLSVAAPPDAPAEAPAVSVGDVPTAAVTEATAPIALAPESLTPEPDCDPDPDRLLPFATWLQTGMLRGRHRYRCDAGPTLWFDLDARQYYGPSTLKPLTRYFERPVQRDAFEPVDDATWSRETGAAGMPQPLSRLVWLGGLLAGDGALAPGYDPDARYQLNRWPRTEREYPRQFRIATAMMKGPATLDGIIAASGLPAEDVLRFVNANLATGYAEPLPDAPAEPEPTERPRGFFARLRLR